MPFSGACSAAMQRPRSDSANRASRFQRSPSGRRTGRFSNRCTSSSSTRPPCSRPSTTRPLSAPRSTAAYAAVGSGKVEDLLEALELAAGEVLRHVGLPARVDVALLHRADGALEALRLEVADEQPVLAQEQRVVGPAGLAQRVEHLRPDLAVAGLVLVQRLGPDAQQKAGALHQTITVSSPSSFPTADTSAATWPTPSATWWVGPCSHQASKNSAGGCEKRRRELVLPMRNVAPGIDSASATSSFRRPSTVCVQPTMVTGP